ncbi:MAG: PHP-associated domain-containing protein [Victivallales bacterium]
MLKADLHTHTNEDNRDLITYCAKELIDAASDKKFDVLAITNHDIFTYTPELIEYAAARGILLVPGIESTIEGKHVIILNPRQDVESVKTFEALKEYRRKHPDIFVIAPHPYYPHLRKYSLKEKLLNNIDLFDGIEYCHYYTSLFDRFNSMARKVAVKYGKPIVGTSDSHHLFQLDKTYSVVDAEKNIDSIISALKNNRIKIVSMPLPLSIYSKTLVFIFFKFFIKRIIFLMRRKNPAP